jgi:hypothetical protein
MGYYTKIIASHFRIPASQHSAICSHLLSTGFLGDTDRMSGIQYGPDGRTTDWWYAWVDMIALAQHLRSGDLRAVLDDFGFDVFTNGNDDVIGIAFDKKSGDEEELLKRMAPMLPDSTFINWQGEDGAIYRWTFPSGKLHTSFGSIVYFEDRTR